MVRATRGSFSGPITMSATTPMTRSSEKPMSNISPPGIKRRPWGASWLDRQGRSGLLFGLALHFAVDRLGVLRRQRGFGRRLVGAAVAHAVLESAHRAAE